jgi:hypothetical protein
MHFDRNDDRHRLSVLIDRRSELVFRSCSKTVRGEYRIRAMYDAGVTTGGEMPVAFDGTASCANPVNGSLAARWPGSQLV